MRKLLTRAIAAALLLAVFSVYGDTSNLVFYADFQNSEDGQVIATAADLNGSTVAPASLYDQIGSWSAGPINKNASQFTAGAPSVSGDIPMAATIGFAKNGGFIAGTLSAASPFSKGAEATRVSFNFKLRGNGTKGFSHTIYGYDEGNTEIFKIVVVGGASTPLPATTVTVNGTTIGLSGRESTPINSISLVLDSNGIEVTLFNGGTSVSTTVKGIPVLGASKLISFKIQLQPTGAPCVFDYDSFEVWSILRAPPPPSLNLILLTP